MSAKYVDTHTHLFFNDFEKDREEVLDRAREVGVRAFIVPGTDLQTSRQAVELAEKNTDVYAAVGFHPHDASKVTEQCLHELELFASHPRVVAIGEIGLDFYYNYSPWDVQKKVFWQQLELAASMNKPVIIHSRDSMPDVLALLESFLEQYPNWKASDNGGVRGVFHCFPGSVDDARTIFEMNFFLSFTGSITFKNSKAVPVLQHIGVSRILLETDAPYMAPVPYRGKRNEPVYIPLIAERIADLCNDSLENVATTTTKNACHLFGISV